MTVKTATLDNGLRIITDTMPHVETVTVGVWVNVGSRYESLEQAGLSHMLEHMAFKGTQSRSAQDIAETIENVGGYFNAYTSREHTTYYIHLLKDNLQVAIEILADIMLNATLDQEELNREKGVILQEIGQTNDTPDDIIYDLWQAEAYPDQALGRPILGTEDSVQAMSRQQLRDFISEHYHSGNLVISAAGNLEHNQLVDYVDHYFAALPIRKNIATPQSSYKGGRTTQHKDLDQVNMLYGYDSISYHDPDYYAAQLMSLALGGGMSSRLFQEIREKRGLVYSVYSLIQPYLDRGSFTVFAGTSPDHANAIIPIIQDQMSHMSHTTMMEEVIRAKTQYKSSLLMSLESTTNRMEQMGRQMLIFNEPIPLERTLLKLEEVDDNAVMRYLDRMLSESPATHAFLGPQ